MTGSKSCQRDESGEKPRGSGGRKVSQSNVPRVAAVYVSLFHAKEVKVKNKQDYNRAPGLPPRASY